MPNRILLIFAHANFEHSRSNRALVRTAAQISGVTLHDLYETYPDFQIDVRAEQQRLLDHEVMVLQHPFHWFGSPPIIKEWMDVVLTPGWAYGQGGRALAGKALLQAISTGGNAEDYGPHGRNQYTIREFLAPYERSFVICGFRYLNPFVIHGSRRLSDLDLTTICERYAARLNELREGNDLE